MLRVGKFNSLHKIYFESNWEIRIDKKARRFHECNRKNWSAQCETIIINESSLWLKHQIKSVDLLITYSK